MLSNNALGVTAIGFNSIASKNFPLNIFLAIFPKAAPSEGLPFSRE